MKSESETHFRFLALKNRLEAEVIQQPLSRRDRSVWLVWIMQRRVNRGNWKISQIVLWFSLIPFQGKHHPHQVGQGTGLHFLHDLGPMGLDRRLAYR